MNIFPKYFKEICMIIFIYMLKTCLFTIKFAHIFFDDKDFCLDTGYCKEGLTLNIEGVRITVDEYTCKKYSGIWYSNRKICNFKMQ